MNDLEQLTDFPVAGDPMAWPNRRTVGAIAAVCIGVVVGLVVGFIVGAILL